MRSFFKAWAASCGILGKLAPHSLQGDLATTLSIYTMNIYDLLEKYAWEGVKAYHFQFHRKRVASGKSIYHALEWQTLDGELIASECFAHPALRLSWSQGYRAGLTPIRKSHELSIRENAPSPAVTESTIIATIHGPNVGYCLFRNPLVTHIPYHVPSLLL